MDRGGETGQVTIHHKAYDRLVAALHAAGRQVIDRGDAAHAQCPAHDDGRPSLSLRRIDGSVLVYCHAGCQIGDVLAALSLDMRDLYDDRAGQTYAYGDGRKVRRTADKKFWQSANTKGRSLFHAERIGAATTVHVVEGEKDVLAVESVGGTAVCSAMGAGKAHLFDWSPLRGREVIIVADRDEPGRKHARDVADIVRGIAASVRIVEAAAGKDAADHIAAGKTLDDLVDVTPPEPGAVDGAALLDELRRWYETYIRVTADDDLSTLAVWTVHTHLVEELYTSPRLVVDSTMPGAGKTTVLDHLSRLCHRPLQAASLSSPALLPRLLDQEMRTILLDEVHRSLRPDRPGVDDILAVINTGYRVGATRPVLIPTKGGGWDTREMPTYAPVAMAGNAPNLPDDTVSRQIRILLMPDLDGTVDDSDWEHIEGDAMELRDRLAAWADQVRDQVRGMAVDLPAGCVGRAKERWRPLARVASAAGGHWPQTVDRIIRADLDYESAERDAGLRRLPPGMVLLCDLHAVWPDHDDLVPTRDLVGRLITHNTEYWGDRSGYGKALTETRLGKLLSQASQVTSVRPGGRGPRGYLRAQLTPVWSRLRIGTPPSSPGAPGEPGSPGAPDDDTHRDNRGNQVHQLKPGAPRVGFIPPTGPGRCQGCGFHVATQGHRDGCPAKTRAPIGGITPATPGMTDRVVAALAKAVER
ncbi:DUF3631 domain-containing protein [Mycobacterium riyadhense]|uniref:DUF3631 domain-containing protein n=1 Tax=Mycobacterium riyadhense TaxID=486698 RepID=UPI001EF9F6D0|nr:DUF3631 domain-containing protein [Mycobacterium riyadhense]